ncbi:hypothetical protein NIES267_24800 [Calothrix parasitica NIES-267]|uniref:Uncharacterized protein n=1 Tax=Calothrix parasitica NIES-267 TaxID=1973488 RepID=A0A1Z4LP99_9CYAN|nr:hypothetical protein NIES267_24800 [Calothrix parasitica NIES-267]
MVIQDLEIIELVDSLALIMGGAKTAANSNSKAGDGIANASAEAAALGKITKTITKTSTSVRKDDIFSSSRASGRAISTAKDGNNISRSSDRSNSYFSDIG